MKKQNPKKKAKEQQKEVVSPQVDDKENPFDFGGLPKRDLKKNLGCG